MDNTRWAVGTFGAISLFLLPALAAISEEKPKVSSLEDYPPAVVQHLLADFAEQKKALEVQGIPATIDDLPGWNACGADHENSYEVYKKAFGIELRSERLRLLAEAAKMPCYQYPFNLKTLKDPVRRFSAIDVDSMSGMRESSRHVANEIVVQTALGDRERAVQSAEAALGLLSHIGKSPFVVEQLCRYACEEIILKSLQDLLSGPSLSEAQLVRLDNALSQALDPALLARIWVTEKLIHPSEDPFAYAAVIHIIEARSYARILAAKTTVAVERHLIATGKLPESLSELIPSYLASVPLDPFNGEPMHYVTTPDSYAVYSVDEDGEVCANPMEIALGEERTLVRIPVVKQARPLSEMSYSMPRGNGKKNTRAEKKAMGRIVSIAGKVTQDGGSKSVMLSAGPLDGGTAVMFDAVSSTDAESPLSPVLAAFWISGGTTYTVNNWARNIAPDFPSAPEAITFDCVRDVVH